MASRNRVTMVDVGRKPQTHRVAVAQGRVRMTPETFARVKAGQIEKGDPLQVARVAGIAAAKRTSDLLPLCHPLSLTRVEVECEPQPPDAVQVTARVEAVDRTGVEMEALTAVAAACLCVYDMCKAYDRAMMVESILLVEKLGGKSGHFKRE
jgi:cyclic pyranopterin phosphate synthase